MTILPSLRTFQIPVQRPFFRRLFATLFTLAALVTTTARAQTPQRVYELNGSYAETNGGSALVPNGGTLGATGYTFAAGQGPSVSNALANTGEYSIEMVFRIDETSSYKSLLNFNNLTADNAFYSLNGQATFYNYSAGNSATIDFIAGQTYRLVVTRNATTKITTAYVNGVQKAQVTDSNDYYVASAAGGILHFLRDNGSEHPSGFLDQIRIYHSVLTPTQVAALNWQAVVNAGNPTVTRYTPVAGSGPVAIDVGTFAAGSARSFEFVFNAAGAGPSKTLLGSRASGAGVQALKLNQYNNTGRFGLTTIGVADYVFTNSPTLSNQQVHAVYTSNGAVTTLYLNGVAQSATVNEGLKITGRNGLGAIEGTTQLAFDDNLDGTITGFASYARALSQAEVTARYNALAGIAPNSPPVVAVNAPASVSTPEGTAPTKTGTFSDTNGNATVTPTASSGTITPNNAAGTWSWTGAVADGTASSTSTITITATDSAGAVATTTFTSTITNVAPVVIITAPTTANEKTSVSFSFTATDPSSADQTAGFAWSINYGDGSPVQNFAAGTASPLARTYTYANPGTYTITATATDKDSGTSTAATKSITITNGAPVVTITAPTSATEDTAVSFSFTATDSNSADQAAGFAWSINYGDGSPVQTVPAGTASPLARTYTYTNPGTYTVTATATDKNAGTSSAATRQITINAAPAPLVTSLTPNEGAITGGTFITITGSNFSGATAVNIGGRPATSLTVVNSTTITCITPARNTGTPLTQSTASVAVTTPGGTNTGGPLFTYFPATLYTVSGSGFIRNTAGSPGLGIDGEPVTFSFTYNDSEFTSPPTSVGNLSIEYIPSAPLPVQLQGGNSGLIAVEPINRIHAQDGIYQGQFFAFPDYWRYRSGSFEANQQTECIVATDPSSQGFFYNLNFVPSFRDANSKVALNNSGSWQKSGDVSFLKNPATGSKVVIYNATWTITSSPAPAPVAPGAPAIGTATAGNGSATVAFTAPASNGGSAIASYEVTSSPGGFTASGPASPLTVTGLTNGTAYTFTVRAINEVGPGPASAASNAITPASVPGAPTIGTATGGNTSASVAFTAPTGNGGSAITSYTVTSSPGGFTASGPASPLTVTGLTNGTAYTFTVTATNVIGTGSASAASNAVTPATVPGAPTIGSATGGNASASVAFTAPTGNGGSAITSYTVTSSPGGFTASGPASPLTVSGLVNGTAYTFTVTATNAVGTGPASSASNAVTPATSPGAPTIGTATRGNASASVTFTAPASNGGSAITSYTVTSNPGGFTASGSASPLTVTGLTNGTAYTFTVTATNLLGTGPTSAASNSVIPATVPGAPTIGTATRGNASASVTFTAPASNGGSAITSYTVTSSPGGFTATGPASPLTVSGLVNGTAYTFTVTATNAVGTGPASAASNAITPLSPPTISNLAPNAGSTVGGTRVTITGTNLNGATAVTIGGVAATNLTVVNSTSLTCTTPAGTVGSASVIVTTPGGSNAANTLFSYFSPGFYTVTGTGVLRNQNSGQAANPAYGIDGETVTFTFTYDETKFARTLDGGNYSNYAPSTAIPVQLVGSISGPISVEPITIANAYNDSGSAFDQWNFRSGINGLVQANSSTSLGFTSNPGTSFAAINSLFVNGFATHWAPSNNVTFGKDGLSPGSTISIGSATWTVAASAPPLLPGAPTIGTATRGNASASVAFTAPASNGGATITSYTVTSSPGGFTATGPASPLTVTGLTNGTAYTFTVTATNLAGTGSASSASNSVTPLGTPNAPTIGTATRGNASASVAFTAPTSNGGSAITSYTVTSSPGGFTASGSASPLTVTGLTNGTAYTFTVTATNAIGTGPASTASNAVTPATVTGAPTIGTATRGNASASVAFTAPAGNGGSAITSYTVTSSPGGFTASGSASPLTVTGLTNGTAYTFTVTATNAVGTGPASAASNAVTPATVPGAPTIGTATGGNASASVAFTAPAGNGGSAITSYTVTSSPGGFTASGSASPLTVTGLTNGTAYTFTVTATNAVGTGPASAASNPATPAALPTVSNITPNAGFTVGGTAVTITGTNFTNPATVSIGGAPATSVTVVNTTTITAVTPPGSAGAASVLVTTANGTNAANSLFTFNSRPEIAIIGGGNLIPDGARAPFASAQTDFGPVATSLGRTFTIQNTGDGTLAIASITVTGENASEFSVSGAPSSVAAGTSATFTVTYTPTSGVATSRATITVTSNDADEAAYDFVVEGEKSFTVTGDTWTAVTAAQDNQWQSVTYGQGLFVAVASDGTHQVMTSPDGMTWTSRLAPENNVWSSVTYGKGLFVAVASTGTFRVMTSPDGITWTARFAPTSNWSSVTYGNGLFVAVPFDGTSNVMTSPDGITWTARIGAASSFWSSVTYGNGVFTALDYNTARTANSSDGILWSAATSIIGNGWRSVVYGGGRFVAVGTSGGTSKVASSLDGSSWFAQSPIPAGAWTSVAYGNGRYASVAGGGTNRIMTSSNVSTWTARTAPEANAWTSVAYGAGRFVAVSSDGTHRVMISTLSPAAVVADWAAGQGLSGADALPTAAPFGDGVPNLLKYAFNMPLDGPRSNSLNPAGGPGANGLPVFTVNATGPNPTFRAQFLRRKNSGLTYVPQRATNLTNFTPMLAAQVVTPIDANWELVTVDEPLGTPVPSTFFSRVTVTLP